MLLRPQNRRLFAHPGTTMDSAQIRNPITSEKLAEQQIEHVFPTAHAGDVTVTYPDKDNFFASESSRTRSLLRKQDMIIMPLMSLSYMYSYLASQPLSLEILLLTQSSGSSGHWQFPYHGLAKGSAFIEHRILQLSHDIL